MKAIASLTAMIASINTSSFSTASNISMGTVEDIANIKTIENVAEGMIELNSTTTNID